jgi:hypothetical protein
VRKTQEGTPAFLGGSWEHAGRSRGFSAAYPVVFEVALFCARHSSRLSPAFYKNTYCVATFTAPSAVKSTPVFLTRHITFLSCVPCAASCCSGLCALCAAMPCSLDPRTWPCGPFRSPCCSLRSSWCLPRSPAVPSGPRGVSVPSGPFGVPPYFPACPPVPLVSLGSCSSTAQHSDSLVRPAAAALFPGVLLPAVRWLSSLAAAHAHAHTKQ